MANELEEERQRTDESLEAERDKVDQLLVPAEAAPVEDAALELALEHAAAHLEGQRQRVDQQLQRIQDQASPHAETVQEAVTAERERADAIIALERARADEALRRERERSAAEALEQERAVTDRSLDDERQTTDETIVAHAERLQIVSHDLKDPLHAIVHSANLIRETASEAPSDDRVRRAAERIDRAAKAMDRLIGDLLTTTALELGRLPVVLREHDLSPLVADVVRTLEALAHEKRLRLQVRLPEAGLRVLCDAGRISQAFSNMLGNAIKFTPVGGAVEVVAARDGDQARITIRDTGPGIPDDELPHVFERHFRGRRAERPGLGLGLYIAKTLVEAHGGTIRCERREDGPGCTFTFTVPLA